MKLITKLLIAVTAILTFSCQKTHDPDKPTDSKIRLTSSRFYHVDGSYYSMSYTYNNHGRLVKENELKEDGSLVFVREYIYEGNKLNSTKLGNSPVIAEFVYSYTQNKLVGSEYLEYVSGPEKQHFKRSFEYAGNKIVKITEQNLEKPASSTYTSFSYSAAGNISEVKEYDLNNNVLISESVIEYDSKKNPYYDLVPDMGLGKYNCPNNVTRVRILREKRQPTDITLNYEYDYNSNGYPIKSYLSGSNGNKIPEESFYYSSY